MGTGGAGGSGRGGTGGGGAGRGGSGGSGGSVVDAGSDGSLGDCNVTICGADQQGVRVRTPGLGVTQCACVSHPDAGVCTDCSTCGQSVCARYDATCTGFSLETGLLCTQPG
jgi:hypothetical protein